MNTNTRYILLNTSYMMLRLKNHNKSALNFQKKQKFDINLY